MDHTIFSIVFFAFVIVVFGITDYLEYRSNK